MAVVVIHAILQCAARVVAYLESSEADTHDVHIGEDKSVEVLVSMLGGRMDYSDSKSKGAVV